MKFLLIPFLLITCFFTFSISGRVNEEAKEINIETHIAKGQIIPEKIFKEMFIMAQELFDYEYYEEALAIFSKLLTSDINNCNINFYVGVCCLKMKLQHTKAIKYLEKAIIKTDVSYSYNYKEKAAPVFAFQYLGQAYHLAGKYSKALASFEAFKTYLTDKNKDAKFLKDVEHDIELTKNAVKLTASPVEVNIESFKIMNSTYSDFSPIISSNGKTFYFTSKRKGTLGGQKDNIGEYLDDIYYSQFKYGRWGKPRKLGAKINSINNDVLSCISSDQTQLYFSRQLSRYYQIFVSLVSKKGKWLTPKKLDKSINDKSNDVCPFISYDGNYLLFSSDKQGGSGGYDIYIAEKKQNGDWGKPKNISTKVNTEYDEMWPVLMTDGTLYFSSKGHENMGGFDVFKATMLEDSTWTEPVNMGYPLNTAYDDISFYPTSTDGKKGYYSSGRAGGYGDGEIYMFTFK